MATYNSYYETEGARHPRAERGTVTRPNLTDVLAWRHHVDSVVQNILPDQSSGVLDLVELGLAHEEQHQELLITDLLDLFSRNPMAPPFGDAEYVDPGEQSRVTHPGGIIRVGAAANEFAFDCEGPAHDVLIQPFQLSSKLVTNREWLAFMEDGGYANPLLWLADGWAWVKREGIHAPLRWRRDGDDWRHFGLGGVRSLELDAPVTHVSHYEADAFAAWAGARLPTEFEWEAAATSCEGLAELYGCRWQWTSSAFLPYPRFKAAAGAIGEYNGKFMSGQCVLRGSSVATSPGHSRASYRNFFYPHQRWQFTGVRLARDV